MLMNVLAVFNIQGFLHYAVRLVSRLQTSISIMRIVGCDKDETFCGGTFIPCLFTLLRLVFAEAGHWICFFFIVPSSDVCLLFLSMIGKEIQIQNNV